MNKLLHFFKQNCPFLHVNFHIMAPLWPMTHTLEAKNKQRFCRVPCGFANPENITVTQTTAVTIKITVESHKNKLTIFWKKFKMASSPLKQHCFLCMNMHNYEKNKQIKWAQQTWKIKFYWEKLAVTLLSLNCLQNLPLVECLSYKRKSNNYSQG